MCKPDAVQRGLVGEIMLRFERRGFRLLAAKIMQAEESLLKTHYADLSKKGFFPELIRYMGSGPVVPMVFQGLNAVKQGRVLLGATNPKDSDPGTIRGDLCIDVGRNVIHGSDGVEAAEKEIKLWFTQEEITSWRSAQTEWVYEEEELEGAVVAAPVKVGPGLRVWSAQLARDTVGTQDFPHVILTLLNNFLCKQLDSEDLKEKFFHPGFGPNFGPIQSPVRKPKRDRNGQFVVQV